MLGLNAMLQPGMIVRSHAHPEWGLGQVQSIIANRITVNFRETGKVVIDGNEVMLAPATEDR